MPTYHIQSNSWILDKEPSLCPRCKKYISAVPQSRASEDDANGLECVFLCPSCDKFFITHYEINRYTGYAEARYSLPNSFTEHSFPRVAKISPAFGTLYNQSAQADATGLNEIAGTGYRKALEFLVKDYCIAVRPGEADAIRRLFLGNVIRDFVDDGKLKRAATMTSWLGNDEGHYERRWHDKDLSDLKALLELTVAFVDEEVQLELYSRSMQPDSPHRLVLLDDTFPRQGD